MQGKLHNFFQWDAGFFRNLKTIGKFGVNLGFALWIHSEFKGNGFT
jgi:hypothetical protein